jgi:acyl dehydratase/catechol 2,3-dioxygenase-like lactoylglutathione lyase family enzyme
MTLSYLEDFQVGQQRTVGEYLVSAEEIIDFAAKWDPQPFHTDREAASASVFGGLTACGPHILAIRTWLLFRMPKKAYVLAGLGIDELRFAAPVRPNDRLSLVSECLEVRPSSTRPDRGIVGSLITVNNQDGRAVLTSKDTIMVARRSADQLPPVILAGAVLGIGHRAEAVRSGRPVGPWHRQASTKMSVIEIEHVQLAMPHGEEQRAREFYSRVLGIPETSKPAPLAERGGCWFESGRLKVHLGVEDDFRPAKKAHPALRVAGLAELVARLRDHGYPVVDGEPLDGVSHVYVCDPFGNRIELIEDAAAR